MLPIDYDIAIEGPSGQVRVDWSDEQGWPREPRPGSQGWVERYSQELATATRLSLVPRAGGRLPVVMVALQPGREWIIFSRVFGTIGPGPGPVHPGQVHGAGGAAGGTERFRLYAIGWKQSLGDDSGAAEGRSARCLLWVYPDGSIECAEEPSADLVQRFM